MTQRPEGEQQAPPPGRPGRARLADVAARAGVSLNTVSRALRAPHTVRPELRKRIEAVLDELNYVPNRLAGGLAGGPAGVVGVIVTSLFYSEFAALLDSMQGALSGAGLSTMLANSHYDPEEELALVRTMLSWRPAAMALVGVDHHPRAAELLHASGVPVVELWEVSERPIDSAVGMDHLAIGASQAEHLLACGYRRLAFVGSLRPHDHRARRRYEGFAAALAAKGLRALRLTSTQGGTADLGERLLGRLLTRHREVDGIVCNGDVVAFGVLRGLARRGRRVPDEVGVVGFGDNEAASCLTPSLTTVRPPRALIGRLAAEIMLARIDGAPPGRRVVAAELVPRESSARRAEAPATAYRVAS